MADPSLTPAAPGEPEDGAAKVGKLLRQSAVYGMAAALTAGEAVKAIYEQARETVVETATAARESFEEAAAQRKKPAEGTGETDRPAE